MPNPIDDQKVLSQAVAKLGSDLIEEHGAQEEFYPKFNKMLGEIAEQAQGLGRFASLAEGLGGPYSQLGKTPEGVEGALDMLHSNLANIVNNVEIPSNVELFRPGSPGYDEAQLASQQHEAKVAAEQQKMEAELASQWEAIKSPDLHERLHAKWEQCKHVVSQVQHYAQKGDDPSIVTQLTNIGKTFSANESLMQGFVGQQLATNLSNAVQKQPAASGPRTAMPAEIAAQQVENVNKIIQQPQTKKLLAENKSSACSTFLKAISKIILLPSLLWEAIRGKSGKLNSEPAAAAPAPQQQVNQAPSSPKTP